MKIRIIIPLLLFGLFIQCKNQIIEKTKIEQILAINNYDYRGSEKFELYSDNTYIFTSIKKIIGPEKVEKFKGIYFLKNDTIYFDQSLHAYNKSKKAVIKNNFIEFVGGIFPLKIEIKKNRLQTKNKLDLRKYNDYAFFTFDSNFYAIYYNYEPNTIKPYDLNQKELIEVNQILKKCFSENNSKLKNLSKYVKQCTAIINDKKEKEVWIKCYCKDFYIENEYKYSLIDMSDGGNCNISLKINLTKHSYSDLSTGGLG
ncbi:hypothetical protein GKZ90_0024295 [Flavobacterium sp. MC2016-06]|jgi:hypothetical protein|uniref:hypothetical protein n=1 Tax=Flavobacterium sp. MC2016-06 TaxID=2676308 RepID=UPI0012BA7CCE|nr:hypothetical protein [Flavobacterium sp. MC2016-06]MBU3861875.1 hypothetical protein [Flavobacterium sp. MC2016-06]